MPLAGKVVLIMFGLCVIFFLILMVIVKPFYDATQSPVPAWLILLSFSPMAVICVLLIKVLLEDEVAAPKIRRFIRFTVAAALGALSYVICSHFSNQAMGVSTGFSAGELKVIPFIVSALAFWRLSGADAKPSETPGAREKLAPADQSLEDSCKPEDK
jgi:hypothetical protein